MTSDGQGLHAIGWKEYIDFPEWGIRHLRAKIDTGACTSALDVVGCTVHPGGPTGRRAEFSLVLSRGLTRRTLQAPVVRLTRVRSSNGNAEERPVVEVPIRLGPVQTRAQFTLTRRSGMRYRILLGRQALAGTFLVDVSRHDLLRQPRDAR